MPRLSSVLAALAVASAPAHAYPEGAPWGAANPLAAENCSTCHFDAEPQMDSPELDVTGLPHRVTPGEVYALELVLTDATVVTAGFQVVIASDGDTGWFSATDKSVEAEGAAVRSNEPASPSNDEPVSWSFVWHASTTLALPAQFYAAATAANDDGSPLGDTIHYRTFIIAEHDATD